MADAAIDGGGVVGSCWHRQTVMATESNGDKNYEEGDQAGEEGGESSEIFDYSEEPGGTWPAWPTSG